MIGSVPIHHQGGQGLQMAVKYVATYKKFRVFLKRSKPV